MTANVSHIKDKYSKMDQINVWKTAFEAML